MTTTAPRLRGDGELHIVRSEGVVTFEDPDGAMHRLVELADGSRSTQELYRALASDYPQVCHDDVVDAVAQLAAAGLVEDAPPWRRDLGGRGEAGSSGLI